MFHPNAIHTILEAHRTEMRAKTRTLADLHRSVQRVQAINAALTARQERIARAKEREEKDTILVHHRQRVAAIMAHGPAITIHGQGFFHQRTQMRSVYIQAIQPGYEPLHYCIEFQSSTETLDDTHNRMLRHIEDIQAIHHQAGDPIIHDGDDAPIDAGISIHALLIDAQTTTSRSAQTIIEKILRKVQRMMHDRQPDDPTPVLTCMGFWQQPYLVRKFFRWKGPVHPVYQCTREEYSGTPTIRELMDIHDIPHQGRSGNIIHTVQAIRAIALAQTAPYA